MPVRDRERPARPCIVEVGVPWATGLHQVDNPVFDSEGNLFVTYSGPRGQEAPVSVFRVRHARHARAVRRRASSTPRRWRSGPTAHLYVSSRFEGAVYRVDDDGTHTQVASDLGVACGLAFDADGWMYVGDRSGTIFRVRDGTATPFATLPPSVAAFHLAMSPWGELFVSGADARHLRPRLSHQRRRRGSHAAARHGPAAGPGVLAGRPAARHRRAGGRQRPVSLPRSQRRARARRVGPRSSAWPSAPTASWRSRPTTPPTGSAPVWDAHEPLRPQADCRARHCRIHPIL